MIQRRVSFGVKHFGERPFHVTLWFRVERACGANELFLVIFSYPFLNVDWFVWIRAWKPFEVQQHHLNLMSFKTLKWISYVVVCCTIVVLISIVKCKWNQSKQSESALFGHPFVLHYNWWRTTELRSSFPLLPCLSMGSQQLCKKVHDFSINFHIVNWTIIPII